VGSDLDGGSAHTCFGGGVLDTCANWEDFVDIYTWILTIYLSLFLRACCFSLLPSSLCIRRQGLAWFGVLRFFIGFSGVLWGLEFTLFSQLIFFFDICIGTGFAAFFFFWVCLYLAFLLMLVYFQTPASEMNEMR